MKTISNNQNIGNIMQAASQQNAFACAIDGMQNNDGVDNNS